MRTAVAQAELTDKELPGAYHKLVFTRARRRRRSRSTPPGPSCSPACVAVVAHPDDERFQPLFGQHATTPLFGVSVPIVAHELADPEKGTGVAMICTFGDTTDVTWWRELSLPVRAIVQRDGRLRPVTWGEPGWECDRPRRGPGRLRRAGRQDREAGAGPHRRAAPGGRRHRRRDPPHHPRGEVLGERHPPARDRHQPAVVHPLPGQGRAARPAARSWPGGRTSCTSATRTGSTA